MVRGKSVKYIVSLTAALLTITVCFAKHDWPSSTCPEFFQYDHHKHGRFFGVILFPANLYANRMTVVINLSIKAFVPQEYYGRIEVLGGRRRAIEQIRQGRPIMYKVIFPPVDKIPKVTEITFNGQIFCIGKPVKWKHDRDLTNYQLQYVLNLQEDDNYSEPLIIPYQRTSYNRNEPTIQIYNIPRITSPVYAAAPYSIELYNQDQNMENPVAIQPQTYQPNYQTAQTAVPAQPEAYYNSPGYQSSEQECGIIYSNALYIKGTAAIKGDWPWMVALYVEKVTSLDFRCAGTLVSHKHVITAAHCVYNAANRPISNQNVLVKVGVFNLQDWSDPDVKQFKVLKISKHPKYTGGPNHLDDIAVLQLDKSVAFNNYILPACIWNMDTDLNKIVGMNGTVIGWGRDEFGLVSTPEPREGRVPIVSTQTCRSSLEQFSRLTSNGTLCAGARDGTGPCNGDSGGGLFLNINRRWYLRAIVSMSIPGSDTPCDLREYVVYTDTAKYLPWIRSVMN